MTNETEQARYQRIFGEGCIAFRRSKSNIDNPYWQQSDGDTEAWNDGWLDALDASQEAEEMGLYDF